MKAETKILKKTEMTVRLMAKLTHCLRARDPFDSRRETQDKNMKQMSQEDDSHSFSGLCSLFLTSSSFRQR